MQYCMFTLFKVLVLKPPYLALPNWECQVAFLPMKFCTLGVCSMHRPSLSRLFLLFCDIGRSSSHTSGFTCKTRSLKRPGTHAVMSSWLRLHFKISAVSWAVTFLINWLPSLTMEGISLAWQDLSSVTRSFWVTKSDRIYCSKEESGTQLCGWHGARPICGSAFWDFIGTSSQSAPHSWHMLSKIPLAKK